ncbi:hypothetical protein CH289_07865 [Rhodococcus sp. RS1C4]|nr:hypothetical protein [Rhodococcus sp. RS1C4]OZC55098.1 hypothetical protein CH289_07865 [Rhodococcus sp. RS1C4]
MSTRTVEFEHTDGYTYTAELGDPKQQWWNIYDSDGQPQTSIYVETIAETGDPYDLEVIEEARDMLNELESWGRRMMGEDDSFEVRRAA